MSVAAAQAPEAQGSVRTEPVVRLVKLSKSLDERAVLIDVTLEIASGEYVALMGANGAGKSTLLKIIATLMPPSSGALELFGEKLGRNSGDLRARIGLIGHQSMLYRDLSVLENLEFYARLYGLKSPEKRARQMLDMAGLAHRAKDPVKAFSRGMTQRAAIARALLHDPELLLADEPFSGLDAPSIEALEGLFGELKRAGKTIVLVNHDIEQTLRLVDRVVILRGGQVVVDRAARGLIAGDVLAEVSG